jgi:2-hydroxychromene-2-carboxylate isomerase
MVTSLLDGLGCRAEAAGRRREAAPPLPLLAVLSGGDEIMETPASIDFYFDPMCPWAYQTSKWIRDVRSRKGFDIRWRFFSLEEVNREEGKKHPWERDWSYGWSQMRIGAWLRRESMDSVDRWYEAVGRAFHEEAVPTQEPDRHREILDQLGLPADTLEQAIADPTTTDEVRSDHDEAVGVHGGFGVPILVFPDGFALYGPVVVPAPTGDEADRLWDHVLGYTEFPNLYELKQPKSGDDLELIATTFEPYLRARSWRTIENPAP